MEGSKNGKKDGWMEERMPRKGKKKGRYRNEKEEKGRIQETTKERKACE